MAASPAGAPPAADHADAGAAPPNSIHCCRRATVRVERHHFRPGEQHLSHDFILTDDDAAPAGATHAQDVLELSMLTIQQQAPSAVDISWEKSPLDY